MAFFERTFNLAQGLASTYGLAQGAGMLEGSQLGGRVGDRIGQRRLLMVAVCLCGALLLGVASRGLPLPFVLALNLAAAVCFGMRATSNAAVMSEQALSARTTLFAFAAATVAGGSAFGTAAGGGAIVDSWGLEALALFCCAAAFASAGVVLRLVRERESGAVTI